MVGDNLSCRCEFQSTRPSRGETLSEPHRRASRLNFNPLAPRGARPRRNRPGRQCRQDFNPLAPRGARPKLHSVADIVCRFQSTRPSRGETSSSGNSSTAAVFQSTRPSRGETMVGDNLSCRCEFQSTRPSRGETHPSATRRHQRPNFNPLAPRGARHHVRHFHRDRVAISIHSPLAGRDPGQHLLPRQVRFQSTRPSRGETACCAVCPGLRDFNPLAPRGARRDAQRSA